MGVDDRAFPVAALHPPDFGLQLIQRLGPAFGAPSAIQAASGVEDRVGLDHVQPGAARLLGEAHLAYRPETGPAVGAAHLEVERQPLDGRDLRERPARPVLRPVGSAHADLERAADTHLHPCLRHGEARRAEPALTWSADSTP